MIFRHNFLAKVALMQEIKNLIILLENYFGLDFNFVLVVFQGGKGVKT